MVCLYSERSSTQIWLEVLDRLKLFPSSAVAFLGSCESLAVVSYNHLTSTLHLGENSFYAVVAGVGVQDVLIGWIRIRKNWHWRLHQPMLGVVKCLLLFLFPLPLDSLDGQPI